MFSFGSSARDLLKLVTPSYRSGVSPELKWKAVISLPYPKKKKKKKREKKEKVLCGLKKMYTNYYGQK